MLSTAAQLLRVTVRRSFRVSRFNLEQPLTGLKAEEISRVTRPWSLKISCGTVAEMFRYSRPHPYAVEDDSHQTRSRGQTTFGPSSATHAGV